MFLNAFFGTLFLAMSVTTMVRSNPFVDPNLPTDMVGTLSVCSDIKSPLVYTYDKSVSRSEDLDIVEYHEAGDTIIYYLNAFDYTIEASKFSVTGLHFGVITADNFATLYEMSITPLWAFAVNAPAPHGSYISICEVGVFPLIQFAYVPYHMDLSYAPVYSTPTVLSHPPVRWIYDFTPNNTGPYYWDLDIETSCNYLTSYLYPLWASAYQSDSVYFDGYNQGYDKGNSEGYDRGYDVGYHAGYLAGVDTTPGNVFTDLAGSLISIPMNVLAGLSVFTILDTPIIGIIMTFMVAGLALFIIKRFI